MRDKILLYLLLISLTFTQSRLGILFLQSGLDKEIAKKLINSGFEISISGKFPDENEIKNYNVVVLQKGGAYLGNKERDILLNFVKEGGGLFIILYKGEHLDDWVGQFQLLDLLNAKLRPELIKDPENQKSGNTPWGIIFALTRNIKPSPITENVNQIWYPISPAGGLSSTLPFEVGEEWQIIVRGEKTSKTEVWRSNARGLSDERIPKESINEPPIFAVREYGKGRIAICGINSSYHFFGGYAKALKGIVVENGIDGVKSDFLRLLINTLSYLSEPSLKSGVSAKFKTNFNVFTERQLPKHPPYNWSKVSFPLPPKIFKGIIGIQTEITGGKGKIEDFVKISKDCNLDFIILLEDFSKLSKEKWENLKEICELNSDDKFLTVPGFKFIDGYGNNYYAFGYKIRFPDDFLLDEERRFSIYEIQDNKKIPGQVAHNLLEFMHNLNRMNLTIGTFLHSKNPCPYYEFRSYDSIAIFTQDFTKNRLELLDELIDGYKHLQNRGESLWPFAISIINHPSQIITAVKEGYINYCEARDLNDLKNQFSSWHPAMAGYQHLRYISNGPKIILWKFIGPRDLETYEWFDWSWWRWRLKLIVESDTGLKTVRVFDGNDLIRNFYPIGEKKFEWEEDFTHGQQHNIFVIAEDLKGKKAISMELFDRPQPLLEEFMCGDRMNQLSYSMQKKPDGTGSQTGFVWGMTPNKGPWAGAGDISPCSTFKPDSELGGMIPGFDGAPWGDPYLSIWPTIKVKFKESQMKILTESARKMRVFTDRILHTADVMIGFGKTDGIYPEEVPPLNVWHTLAPCSETKLMDVYIMRTYFNLRPGLLSSILVDLSITFKDNYQIDSLSIGNLVLSNSSKWFIRTEKGEIISGEKNEINNIKKENLTNKGYLALCGSPLGSVVIFNLSSQPLEIRGGMLYLPFEGKEVRKGEKIDLKLLVIGAPFTIEPNVNWIEKIRKDFYLNEDNGYKFEVNSGEVIGKKYTLIINGKGEGFFGRFKKEELMLTLPIIVKNLNERWSVFLVENNRARPIGIYKDSAYTTIDLRDGDKEIFVGHPVVCNDIDIFINVVQTDEKEFTVYIHNPSEKIKLIEIETSKNWHLGNIPKTKLELAPGEIKILKTYF